MDDGEPHIQRIYSYGKSKELGKLLGLDDTIQILICLMESPQQYKEIICQISLSDPSLSRRLKIMQSLNIIKKQPIRSRKRSTHAYSLTIRGEKLMKFIESYEREIKISAEQQKIIEIEKL